MMKVLCISNYIVRQIGTQNTQNVQRMRLRPVVPQNDIEVFQVNQKVLCPDAKAVEDAIIFDENPTSVQEEKSDDEPEEMADINQKTEKPSTSDADTPKTVARRTSINFDTFRLPCTLVPKGDQNHKRDNSAGSHKNSCRKTGMQPQSNNTTRRSKSTGTRYNLRGNPPHKRYSDFLIHQTNDVHTALRPVSTQREGTHTQSRQQQASSENIRYSEEAEVCQSNWQKNHRKISVFKWTHAKTTA